MKNEIRIINTEQKEKKGGGAFHSIIQLDIRFKGYPPAPQLPKTINRCKKIIGKIWKYHA